MICYLEEMIKDNYMNLGYDKKPEKINFIFTDFSARKKRKKGYKSIVHAFSNGKYPDFVIKYSNVASVKEEIKNECYNLLTIYERAGDSLKNMFPALMFQTDIFDYKVIVQSYLKGTHFDSFIPTNRSNLSINKPLTKIMELGFSTLSIFHSKMKVGNLVFNQEDLLETPLYALLWRLEMADRNLKNVYADKILDISERLYNKTLPTTMVHHDYCPHHLLKHKKDISIIDWDTAVDNSFPLYDIYRFISSIIFSIARSYDIEINYNLILEFYKQGNNFVKILSKYVNAYSASLDINFDLILYTKLVMLNEIILYQICPNRSVVNDNKHLKNILSKCLYELTKEYS